MGRLAMMMAGKGAIRRVMLKRSGEEVGIIPLSTQDDQDAQVDALRHCEKRLVNPGTAAGSPIYQVEYGNQLVARFLVDPANPAQRLADNADEVRKMLVKEEIDLLIAEYFRNLAQVNPDMDEISEEEVKELGEASPSDTGSAGDSPTRSRRSSAFRRVR